MKKLTANNMKRCIGCYSCSLACARNVHKSLSWKRSGIRIHSSGGISTGYEATVCLACDPPPCATVCPTEALKPRKGGGIILKESLCIHCGECAKACPVDAIYFDPEKNIPVFCIHCGMCVPYCPHNCIEMTATSEEENDE
ncbi:MAG: 4Fe-4S dicluster domain-containing protein [Desulfonatronovibrio sp.]